MHAAALLFAWIAATVGQSQSLDHEGQTWRYLFAKPIGKAKGLILALHGGGGNGPQFDRTARWTAKAVASGYAVVVPTGQPVRSGQTPNFQTNPNVWNSGQLNPGSPRTFTNDVDFLAKLRDRCRETTGEVPVFLTGHSNGAAMALRTSAAWGDTVAGVAVMAGQFPKSLGTPPKQGIPMLYIAGELDELTPWRGGDSQTPWGRKANEPVLDMVGRWVKWQGIDANPIESSGKGYRTYQWGAVDSRRQARIVRIDGHGHAWPGGVPTAIDRSMGPASDAVDATNEILSFFDAVASGQIR